MIRVNKNPMGRVNNIVFGLCELIDGLVRISSLGFLDSTIALDHTRRSAKRAFAKLRQKSVDNICP